MKEKKNSIAGPKRLSKHVLIREVPVKTWLQTNRSKSFHENNYYKFKINNHTPIIYPILF